MYYGTVKKRNASFAEYFFFFFIKRGKRKHAFIAADVRATIALSGTILTILRRTTSINFFMTASAQNWVGRGIETEREVEFSLPADNF